MKIMKNIFKLPVYVGIILKDHNDILLVQRHNTDWMSGHWNFPGGLLEENETLTTAAARETLEEVGVVVDPSDYIRMTNVYPMFNVRVYLNEAVEQREF